MALVGVLLCLAKAGGGRRLWEMHVRKMVPDILNLELFTLFAAYRWELMRVQSAGC